MEIRKRTIRITRRTRPLTNDEQLRIEQRFNELQQMSPKYGAYAWLRHCAITSVIVNKRNSSEYGRYLQRRRGPKAISRSPFHRERLRRQSPVAVQAHLVKQAWRKRQQGKPLTSKQKAALAGNWTKATKPTDALFRDRLQVKSSTQKFETKIEKNGSRLTSGTQFARTNRNSEKGQW